MSCWEFILFLVQVGYALVVHHHPFFQEVLQALVEPFGAGLEEAVGTGLQLDDGHQAFLVLAGVGLVGEHQGVDLLVGRDELKQCSVASYQEMG